MPKITWQGVANVTAHAYECPYCENQVASQKAFFASEGHRIFLCPMCQEPTYFKDSDQIPGSSFGDNVSDLPADVESLYNEARRCMAVSSYTGAAMLARNVLMNVAVAEEAEEGKSFAHYVDYLASKGYVPPKGKPWVDHIRTKGNEANHEILAITREDAEELILFTGMLLRFMYELPAKRPPQGRAT